MLNIQISFLSGMFHPRFWTRAQITCVSMNEDHIVFSGLIILTQPVGLLQGIQGPSWSTRRVKIHLYVRVGTDIPVVSSSPDAIVLVVLGGGAALDGIANRPFSPHLPPGNYMTAAPCHQEHGEDRHGRERAHLGDVFSWRVRFGNWWSTPADGRSAVTLPPGITVLFLRSLSLFVLSLFRSEDLPSLNLPHLSVPRHRMTRSILVSSIGLFFCERWQMEIVFSRVRMRV